MEFFSSALHHDRIAFSNPQLEELAYQSKDCAWALFRERAMTSPGRIPARAAVEPGTTDATTTPALDSRNARSARPTAIGCRPRAADHAVSEKVLGHAPGPVDGNRRKPYPRNHRLARRSPVDADHLTGSVYQRSTGVSGLIDASV